MRLLFLAGALNGLGMFAAAEDAPPVEIMSLAEDAAPPAATIDDIAWLEGHWKGSGLGGVSEEIVAPATGGQMMGMFRQSTAEGTLEFYEFYHFAEEDGSLILRIKHFHPDLTGWEEREERVEFPLVAIGEQTAYFDGLTFTLTEKGELRAAVKTGGTSRADFSYSKVD